MDRIKQAREGFARVYGDDENVRVYFSPGRVNLIGDHTDYNGGRVFPCALTDGTLFAVRRRGDDTLRMYSENFAQEGITEGSLADLDALRGSGWTAYPAGSIWAVKQAGYAVDGGLDLWISGNIPNGAGLSSSASVEVGTITAVSDLFDLGISSAEAAALGQKGENGFNGVACGIMDQFAVAMGQKDHAVLLDTNTLQYAQVPLELGDATLVIAFTNKQRKLGESKYNERRAQCEEALRRIQTRVNAASLGALRSADLPALEDVIADPVLFKRARHAVTENERVGEAAERLSAGDLAGFGALMTASHESLKHDYEVTGIELDTLAETAAAYPGVLGARMTGAGFGGCCVILVRTDAAEGMIRSVGDTYREKIGYAADFFFASAGQGACRLD
ncbi:MAG: galactokinase [Lachnospiraceae bacterium]|nr:galactokinase [Lachnospiraceae bacterium]